MAEPATLAPPDESLSCPVGLHQRDALTDRAALGFCGPDVDIEDKLSDFLLVGVCRVDTLLYGVQACAVVFEEGEDAAHLVLTTGQAAQLPYRDAMRFSQPNDL